MAVLTDAQKEAIVVQLGRFRRHAEVVAFMKDEHGVEIDVQRVRVYDPTHPRFDADREKWEPIFLAAREAYLTDVKLVPAANQAWRLNVLQEGIEYAKKARNWKLAADLMEQAAKEVGGVLTNSRELNINDGRRAKDMSSEDRASLLGSLVSEALASRKDAQPTKH